ncbi:lysophospholipase [Russula ochroleuca]|jgi:acylglycerol lipase|uniref:Lysophospholipase n=1 Tax=Russula ochroleuca TaxID=152965 RepID=A0A9P5TC06_9AGAM|nr:lysophospholipase [Russula ochroleuca]
MSSFTDAWLPGPKSISFYTRTYHPPSGSPRAVVVFIHGFAEHVVRYEYVHRRWADRGFSVFTFDQRGFGRTALDSKKSPSAVYGRTGDADQISDVAWALQIAQEANPTVPIFLMGHSMGGALVLSFVTRPHTQESVSQLSGIIASSPCIRLTKPPASITRLLGGIARAILPNQNIPASVDPKHLSRDPAVVKDNETDQLIRRSASLRAVDDMLSRGENLVIKDYKKWPTALPVLVVHGTEDKVCSVEAAKQFVEKLPASDKKISLYEGAYHELQNEPDGVKEKFTDECAAWAEEHFYTAAGEATQARL